MGISGLTELYNLDYQWLAKQNPRHFILKSVLVSPQAAPAPESSAFATTKKPEYQRHSGSVN